MAKAKINPAFTYKTRDGKEVTELKIVQESSYPVSAKVNGIEKSYTLQGHYYNAKNISGYDLIKQPAKKVNLPSVSNIARQQNGIPEDTTPQVTQHKHHDLIVAWAKNPKLQTQFKSPHDNGWYNNHISDPHWYEENEYQFKPEEPKMLTIIGADGKARSYPEPCKVKLDRYQGYFLASIGRACGDYFDKISWTNDSYDNVCLQKGLVHLTKEAAELHAKAMLGID